MTPAEFTDYVPRIAWAVGAALLRGVVSKETKFEVVEDPGKLVDGATAGTQIVFTRQTAFGDLPRSYLEFNPARRGWVLCSPPLVRGHDLQIITFSAKSTWTDPESGAALENAECIRLFMAVTRELKKYLKLRPLRVHVGNNNMGGLANVYCSKGAIDWAAGGGKLRESDGKTEFRPETDVPRK